MQRLDGGVGAGGRRIGANKGLGGGLHSKEFSEYAASGQDLLRHKIEVGSAAPSVSSSNLHGGAGQASAIRLPGASGVKSSKQAGKHVHPNHAGGTQQHSGALLLNAKP
jgi:hypothetical protein